jgi:hypothetical protein
MVNLTYFSRFHDSRIFFGKPPFSTLHSFIKDAFKLLHRLRGRLGGGFFKPIPNAPKPNTHTMSSHTVSLKRQNRATLERRGGNILRSLQKMKGGKTLKPNLVAVGFNPQNRIPKTHFTLFNRIGHVFDRLSTVFRLFQQIFGFLCFRLKNPPITYHN